MCVRSRPSAFPRPFILRGTAESIRGLSRTFIGTLRVGAGGNLSPKGAIGWLVLCCTTVGFAGATFVFLEVQILQAYPFYNGVSGNEPLFPGITYTVGMEIFAILAFIGVLSWSYFRAPGGWTRRLEQATGDTLLIFGILIASIVYVETRLLWGEIAPGIHLWQGLPGGGGYPWGTEQVAYNTCLIASSVLGDCAFLNYNELFWLAVLCTIVGFVMKYSFSNDTT